MKSKGQSKISSFCESLMNVAIGYVINLGAQTLIFPLYGIHIALSTNIYIGLWFALISIARSYILRRFFNKKLEEVK